MEKSEIKIVFMGTPNISANLLESLINDGFNIVAVIAQPDKPKGRKGILEKVPTKVVAEKYGIPVYQPVKLKKDFDFLKSFESDIFLTMAFGQILSQEVLDIPKYGCLNLHGSLLPKYRGASPIQTALFNGETISGVTLMEMIKEMDAGNIIAKEEVKIDIDDNCTSLFNKMSFAAFKLCQEKLLPYLNKQIKSVPQNSEEATYCHIIKADQEHIDLSLNVKNIFNLIRGLSDEPGAYLMLEETKIKIFRAHYDEKIRSKIIGEIVEADKNGLAFQTNGGCLFIDELDRKSTRLNSSH